MSKVILFTPAFLLRMVLARLLSFWVLMVLPAQAPASVRWIGKSSPASCTGSVWFRVQR